MKQIDINISLTGTVFQTISLDIDITPEEFLKGLKNGDYLTTISHGNNGGGIYQLDGFKLIGKVISQESVDDMEFLDFSIDKN